MNHFRTNNFVRAVVWVSFAAIMYLILADIVRPWIDLPSFGNIGYTLVFVCFALIHCPAAKGLRRTAIFFIWTGLISYLFEETGVRTGLIYGPYHYSMSLGPKLGHVPVLIPLAWFMMIYPSWIVARAILRRVDKNSLAGIIALAVVAAMVMTAWDAVMDPGMSAAGNWIWETGGSYFGVPLRNYFGWMVTTFIVYVGAGFLFRDSTQPAPSQRSHSPGHAGLGPVLGPTLAFAVLPIIVYAFYSLCYILHNRLPALRVVAVFSMGFPALLALLQAFMPAAMHLPNSESRPF